MDITLRRAEDAAELTARIGRAREAKQRDRLRAVALAIGGHPTPEIVRMLGRSRGFVQRWCYACRDGGLDAVAVKRQPGRPTMLPAERHAAFKQRVLAGPTDDDGVCTLRGRDFQRILEEEFGVSYSLQGVYDLLHRLNLSVLVPRPQHRKSDPQAQQQWVEDAPFLSATSKSDTPASTSPSGSRMKRGSGSKAR
jgi:transposase